MRRLLALALLLASTTAFGQWNTGPYGGIGIGQLEYGTDLFGISIDDTADFHKIYGGYKFDGPFAFEVAYVPTFDLYWAGSGMLNPIGDFSARVIGDFEFWEIRGLAYMGPFIFGGGYHHSDTTLIFSGTSELVESFTTGLNGSDRGFSFIFGGEWSFGDWTIRGEYEILDKEAPTAADALSISLHYTF